MRRRKKHYEINPEDIFLDASNLPSFNKEQFEGRIVKPLEKNSLGIFSGVVCITLLVLLIQAFMLQGVYGATYAKQSEKNTLTRKVIFAERGRLLDRNGVALVSNVPGDDTYSHREYLESGFSHLLGYVSYPGRDSKGVFFSYDTEGVAGAEALFDERLRGSNGVRLTETDAKGQVVSEGTVELANNGEDIPLSIDVRVQSALFKALEEGADKTPYVGGAGVIMDIETGEIIALTSYPEYDSNILSDGEDRQTIAGYSTNTRRPYLNRALGGAYAPGSIVKPFVLLGALTDGIVTPNTTFVSTGSISIPNPYNPSKPTIFKDWKAHGVVDARKAIAVSSDVYFYIVGGGYQGRVGLGIDKLHEWFTYFGFGQKTGIALPGEAVGVVPSKEWKKETFDEEWNIGNTYHTSIGQYGFTTTVLQVVRAMAILGNGGHVLTPTIERAVETPITPTIPLDRDALQVVREGMEEAASPGGTAGAVIVPYLSIAAKTGSAELGAEKQFINSWIAGYFPRENPRYAFAVVMERGPVSNLYGAGGVMRETLNALHSQYPAMFINGTLTLDTEKVQ